ncbi:MAG: NAD(P)/FAD-dependent oxidoreductase [Lentisphaeria bacterium]|nr:NAD(P)/FAD-dependent oxidoreductase [Lentisphaeria bacterium]
MKRVIIVGGGFAGINAAKKLGNKPGFQVTLIDRRNHHLFQPLLYQVAMAGLSPADIATPIRRLLAQYDNITVLMANVDKVNPKEKTIECDIGTYEFDYLIMACGSRHTYFGNDQWEEFAPGLKTINQATEIRRRVFTAFERAEAAQCEHQQRENLTFVVVGGGPTGVELAGSIGEMCKYTLSKDFHRVKVKNARVILLEAGPKILAAFDDKQSERARKDLEKLGVEVRLGKAVTHIDNDKVIVGNETIETKTVIWGAGVVAGRLGGTLGVDQDREKRIIVESNLSIKEYPYIFIAGDQANFTGKDGKPLPGMAPVAIQQGQYLAKLLINKEKGIDVPPFKYLDKGKMATIGRKSAIVDAGSFKVNGFMAWLIWLFIHILYLSGFKNKLFVFAQWGWSYLSYGRGARLITGKKWRFYDKDMQNGVK